MCMYLYIAIYIYDDKDRCRHKHRYRYLFSSFFPETWYPFFNPGKYLLCVCFVLLYLNISSPSCASSSLSGTPDSFM